MESHCIHGYLSLCRSYGFSAPWGTIPVDRAAFYGPSDPAVALQVLLEQYSATSLLAAGLVQLADHGQHCLHPFLAAPHVPLVALRERRGRFTNLMTDQGCVNKPQLLLQEVLQDSRTLHFLQGISQTLFLADSIETVILLRSWGIAAMPANGVNLFDKQILQLLTERFGLQRGPSLRELEARPNLSLLVPPPAADQGAKKASTAEPAESPPSPPEASQSAGESSPSPSDTSSPESSPPESSPPESSPPESSPPESSPPESSLSPSETDSEAPEAMPISLGLVRWSPMSLSLVEPAPIRQQVKHLDDLHQYRRFEFFDLQQWVPTEQHLQVIEFACSRQEPEWIREAVLDSVFEDISYLPSSPPEGLAPPPPSDLAASFAALQNSLLEDPSSPGVQQRAQEAIHNYCRLIQQETVGPLLAHAQATKNPMDRLLRIQLSQLCAQYFEQMAMLQECTWRARAARNPPGPAGKDKTFAHALALSSQIITLAKQCLR